MLLPNLPPPVEGIRHQTHGVEAYISQRCLGSGTLYIAESRLSWAKEGSTDGLSLEYPHIAVHAVSRDTTNFQHQCLYLMLDINIDDNISAANGFHDDHSDEDDTHELTEIRFVPRDASMLDFMYKSLNDCQVLHPDPEDQPSDDGLGDDDDEGVYDIAEHEEADPADYEQNMEEDLEANPIGNGGHDGGSDDIDMGQFEDAEM